MKCTKCQSENVTIQAVTETHKKKHGAIWWICCSWWIWIVWIFAFLPMALISIIKGKKTVNKTHSEAVCQNCGNHWKV